MDEPAAVPSPQPPPRLGKYELRGEIGRGTCGIVYQGFDPFVQRQVAIKLALPDAGISADAAHEQAFFAEARAAGLLAHPHIVALYDAGVEGPWSYLVMEYIDGQTLMPLCRGSQRPPLDQVLDIVEKCALALDYAHGRGVLHRDIKPGNIMLTHAGVPKLMDFSIAEIRGDRDSRDPQNVVRGSPLYMAPEQIRREPLGPATDLYALGAVMFQLLAGQPPFAVQELPLLFQAIRQQPAPRLRELRPELPEAVSEVVARLLAKAPAERYASGAELAGQLSRIFEQLKLAGRVASRRESRDSLRRLHFFNGFADSEMEEILNASSMATFQPGQPLMSEGEVDNAFYILALGSAEVRKGGKTLYRLERGDCVGEIGFLSASRRTATVVALSRVLALRISAELMDQVSRDCQLRFYKVFTQTLIYRLSMASARLSAASST